MGECALTDDEWRSIGRAMRHKAQARTCPVCEGSFRSDDARQRYCTRECYREAASVRLYFLLHRRASRNLAYRERLRVYRRIVGR